MAPTKSNFALHAFALATSAATLVLIGVGGLVTSHGVGMSVPDWPTTYGYNLFFFPSSKWVGGIFYEHTHRLTASAVGLMTTVLMVWLWLKEERRWLRWLGLGAFLAVVGQGVLGGLRVTMLQDELGIFHATLAQMFFALLCAIPLFTSSWWRRSTASQIPVYERAGLRYVYRFATGMILLQLILGATMRHQHAGLAIPDFPTAYGNWWPAMDAHSIARYNQLRGEVTALNPITAFQVALQMVHRIVALLIASSVGWAAWRSWRALGPKMPLTRLALGWVGLVLAQAALGAATIWTNKSADIATAHVTVGALTLATGTTLMLMARRTLVEPTLAKAPLSVEPARVESSPANLPV